MDWKEYKVNPPEGMFEELSGRLRRRRAWRIGGTVAATAGVIVAAVLLLTPAPRQQQVAMADTDVQPNVAVSEQATATTETTAVSAVATTDATPSQVVETPHNETVAQEAAPAKEENTVLPVVAATTRQPEVQANVQTAEAPTKHEEKPVDVQYIETVLASNDNTDTSHITLPEQPLQQPSPKASEPEPAPYHEDNILWIPNVIVPGDENISNRTFRIKATSEISDFNIHIYNRGGRLLFSSNNPAFTWDATIEGMPVPQGAYVWVVTYRDTDGNPHKQAGTVTVVR